MAPCQLARALAGVARTRSTGFAVAGLAPPTCLIPEYEVFASVALAPYRTPGTPEMGKLVADLVDRFGPRLAHLNGLLQVLSQLSSTSGGPNAPHAS